jgi:HEAT repeat protein
MRCLPLRSMIFSLSLATSVALCPVASAADASVARQVQDLLAAYEEAPGAQELQALGPEAADVLRGLAQDAHQPVSTRARAVHALGWFPDATDHDLLLGWAQDGSTEKILRRKAVFALVNGWGEAAIPEVAPLLADDDVQLRLAVVRALSGLPADKVRDVLQNRLAVEQSRTVRDALTRAIQ